MRYFPLVAILLWLTTPVIGQELETQNNTSYENKQQEVKDPHKPRMTSVDVCPPWIRSRILKNVSPSARDRAERAINTLSHHNLKDSSIHMDVIEKLEPMPDTIIGHGNFKKKRYPIMDWFMVTRPGAKNFVAVIGIRNTAPAILNPSEYFVYDQIPTLKELTIHDADQLWGNGQAIGRVRSNERTYKLISESQDHRLAEFFLDVVFANNRLQKYQIRSTEIKCPGWLSDNREEVE